MDATPVATRLRRSIPDHDAYTVRVLDRRVAALATAHPGDARRWICKTRWLHYPLLCSARLVVGLGVQWTPVRGRGRAGTPPPATLQLCVGHRCLVFHLAQVHPDAVPAALHRFLADPRVVFVGYGSAYDRRMLRDHYGLHVQCGRDLRALTGMGNASVDLMAQRFLGYHGITKPVSVAMSAWHAPRLSVEQVEYACVDAYLAFRLAVLLCHDAHQPVPVPPRAPVNVHAPPRAPATQLHRAPPPARRAPPPAREIAHAPPRGPVPQLHRAPPPAPRAPPPAREIVHAPRRGPVPQLHRAPPPAPRASVIVPVLDLHRAPGPAVVFPRAAPRTPVRPGTPPPAPRAPEPQHAVGSSSNISDTDTERGGLSLVRSNYASPGFTRPLDTEITGRAGLSLVRSNYVSDDDGDLSSDDFELLVLGREAVTDDDEEEDIYDYVASTGLLSDGDYVVGPGGDHSDDDEEGACVVGEQGYAYKDYAGTGILTVEDDIEEGEYIGILTIENDIEEGEYTGVLTVENEAAACDNQVFVTNGPATVASEEEGGLQLDDGHHAPPEHLGEAEAEYYGDSTGVFQGGEDGYGQEDDRSDCYDQVEDVYVQDQDGYEPYDAFY
ncbi:hypothetical protein QYE76_043190 [Lolium multiflorum]|uniref:3'-5' exonuclease domain-containing protein n=1 Tax=Lolium multiflorum TaxID=4521 RepID=A0AAD8TIJ2_LOLMU|nr:hypothetical protein QYE76_043190 [Lolium multiflorum]